MDMQTKDWFFEIIYYNNQRMSLDILDSVIIISTCVNSLTQEEARKSARKWAINDPLMINGWKVRVIPCTKSRAAQLLYISKYGIQD